jgi:hypothetical protein
VGTTGRLTRRQAMGSAHINAHNMRRRAGNVVVEYDGAKGDRLQRTFPTNGAARRFYLVMSVAGRNPRVVAAEINGQPHGGKA